jgi:hypothetical protein
MLDAGSKPTRFSEAERVRWAQALPDIAGEWVKSNEAKGLPARRVLTEFMIEIRRGGGKPVRDWDKAAQ